MVAGALGLEGGGFGVAVIGAFLGRYLFFVSLLPKNMALLRLERTGMNIKRLLGFDICKEAYAYGHDSDYGYTSVAKIPERWVRTTCGYCSVG